MEFFFTDLLHSYSGGHDKLDESEWLSGFLGRWGFEGLKLSSQEISALRKLRGAIINILEDREKDAEPDQKDLNIVKSALEGAPMRHELIKGEEGFSLSLKPVENGFDWMMHEIAAPFGELLSSGDLCRIKFCDNDECHWVFYDESKNCTRRWCGDTCGNLIKVREFRKRKKEKES